MTDSGRMKIEWARTHMLVSAEIRKKFLKEKPLKGFRIGMALHVEAKTGVFSILLKEGGAQIKMSSCNPLSSDDDVVDSLKKDHGMDVYARKGESNQEYYEYLNKVLDMKPNIIIDDGGDLVRIVHTERRDLLSEIIGGNEETTTGVNRLRAMEKQGKLEFPMFDVNDADMKHLFDNRYGTGQSTLDGIMHATNILIGGKTVTVGGYGFCGKGIAMRMKGMGANVIVTEVDPVKAVEAYMDGFRVMPMRDALKVSDMAVTATGMKNVISYEDMKSAKNGIILSNSGHFNNEIETAALSEKSVKKHMARDNVMSYLLPGGNEIFLISEGRLVNLASGQGHPVEIMDMSFAIQALTAEYLAKNHSKLQKKVYKVPDEIDREVAVLELKGLGLSIDSLSKEQIDYSDDWQEGT
ncbi:MAG: adenosylhomocysteinase [Thermoplasmataceae archaeon]|jgi:adenosylhomocysteinase